MSVSLINGHIDRDTSGMTDKEIIKALECCGDEEELHWCTECPYYDKENDFCQEDLHRDALDLISRQQAEIEELKKVVIDDYASEYDSKIRAEAIKEFAEQVQIEIRKALKNNYEVRRERIERIEDERIFVCGDSFVQYCDGKIHALDGINAFIYDLVKEKAGDDK